MNSVQEVNKHPLATTNATTTADKNKNSVENPQDRFLKLLVTQMQNQDPLNPLDNAEVTSQLAQISTVTGIDKLNDTLQLLLDGIEDSRTLEAANLIGHKALVPGTTLSLENNAAIGGFELPQSVDKLSVTILDSSGIAVRTLDLGAQPAGVNTFIWDGAADSGANAANGNYSFAIKAAQGDQEITTSPLALGQVSGVSPGEHDAILDMGELGLVGMTDIKQIFK
ncbi:flagellar basal-body rod modification protein FlgD [Nitrosomonas sp. Nm51]|uniref:flagellar hook assembly protein FlgD n=1 Tax=Nitrosomonas sp. Nm51 TaxID=133720 RepID=UPI0008CDA57F|nr:flagellar hook assembly protein FlgD [Nitrosomonas sp. Nm51]SER12099.1 flagellar basal-body rod modification protein FlgD [Nitrosomonas sp. Nm51]